MALKHHAAKLKSEAVMLESYAALAGIRDSLLETYASNDAMNQLILARLDPRAWRAQLPDLKGNGRTIAALFSHLHNCRLTWLRNSAPHLKRPAALDPHRCTMKQAAAAHEKSAEQCVRMLTDALSGSPNRRVAKFIRDGYVPTWPAGGTMFAYMFSHEAHHRGQILLLAHQLGYRMAEPNIWQWEKLWKQAGLTTRPR
ncbi:MAG: DinB family protein [Candidatus Acidiferrum sp.]